MRAWAFWSVRVVGSGVSDVGNVWLVGISRGSGSEGWCGVTVLGALVLTFLVVGAVFLVTMVILTVDAPLAPVWVFEGIIYGAVGCGVGVVVCCLVGVWSSVS